MTKILDCGLSLRKGGGVVISERFLLRCDDDFTFCTLSFRHHTHKNLYYFQASENKSSIGSFKIPGKSSLAKFVSKNRNHLRKEVLHYSY